MKYSLSRTIILSFAILAFALILVSKLFLVQIVHSGSYLDRADRQYATPSANIFERGTIYLTRRDGELISAATQTSGFKIAIAPGKIAPPEQTFEKLSRITVLEENDFLEKAEKIDDPYEEVVNHLSKKEADAVSALKIPGVSVFKEKWRFYPGGNLASHLLGFVGFQGDELSGRYGLEREYDDVLSRSKDNPYVNFFAEVFSDLRNVLFNGDDRGGDIVTTVEPAVQGFLEKELSLVQEKYQADSIGGIIMDPLDGSIYALGVKPDFDPNNFSKVKNISTFTNPIVENIFEFGSVVKPLVMASALDVRAVTASTTYEDRGSVVVENKEIFNFDKKGRGVVNMQEVLSQSLNTGMVFVYKKLGRQNMRDYMFSFGLKDKTGIDLPNEIGGKGANLTTPRDIEYANASFGQGIAWTPIGLIRALASLANGGVLVTPHLVAEVKYTDGTSKKMEYQTKPTKITKQTSEEITRMLVVIMDKALRSGAAKFEHWSVAVKTGTAQVAKPGGYYEDRYLHSFFGYFPAYKPKFIIFLYAVNPKGVRFSSETWTDPFLAITKFLLNYYEVPPDR